MFEMTTRWFLGMVVGSTIVLSANCAICTLCSSEAIAQVTPDRTLPNNSIVTPDGSTFNITGGTQAAGNLFHSFQQFSVPNGGTAFFNNATDIQNIFSRVTGGSVSDINGIIRANGTANLFLMNPNGIIFGRNASLNIGGSFVATTASAIGFGDRAFFSATNPNNSELLTVNPNAFFFDRIAAAPIQNNSVSPAGTAPIGLPSSGLRVPDGRSLLLLGGNVSLDGGRIRAYGGRVELGGLAEPGAVGLGVDGNNLSLDFPAESTRANVSLTSGASVRVDAAGDGFIALKAARIEILGGSILGAGIGQRLGSGIAVAGDITLDATGEIRVVGSAVFNDVQSQAIGNGGNIIISSGSLSLTEGAQLTASTFGRGRAGNINIDVTGAVTIAGVKDGFASEIRSDLRKEAIGKGGDITISSGLLSLTEGARLVASTLGQGDAGNILIQARDTVSLTEGARLAASTLGQGNAGNILIQARDTVSLKSVFVFSTVETDAVGNGGQIRIEAGSLSVTNGAQLIANTRGQGIAGNIIIDARERVSLDGTSSNGRFNSAAASTVDLTGKGKGGDILINTGNLSLTNGAELNTNTRGQGSAGNVIVNARDLVSFDGRSSDGRFGSNAVSNVTSSGIGNGGDIRITTRSLSVTNGAQLVASTFGRGDAGNIIIESRDNVSFNGLGRDSRFNTGAASTVEYRAVGKGGNININTIGELSLTNGALLDANSSGEGRAGNIEVNARSIRLNNQGSIITGTTSGDGGDITLKLRDILLLRNNSSVTATAGRLQAGGDGGNITINAPSGFIVTAPNENSDITANAFSGSGGRVTINVTDIFGIAPLSRQDLARLSQDLNPTDLLTNDITAISQTDASLSGTIELNIPEIEVNSGLVELPTIPVDTEIAQSCTAGGSQARSSFNVTGRGGLPPNPGEPLTTDTVSVDLVTLDPASFRSSTARPSSVTTKPIPEPIVEATGWETNEKGEVILTADSSSSSSHAPWLTPTNCTPSS